MFSILSRREKPLFFELGEAVQPEKCKGVQNCLGCVQNPQRQVHHGMMVGHHLSRKNALLSGKRDRRKVPIFREKDAFCPIPGCRSENALLGALIECRSCQLEQALLAKIKWNSARYAIPYLM